MNFGRHNQHMLEVEITHMWYSCLGLAEPLVYFEETLQLLDTFFVTSETSVVHAM